MIDATARMQPSRTTTEQSPARPAFTISQIAGVLGLARKTVRQQLDGARPSSSIVVKGQAADAWAVDDLPPAFATRLRAVADGQCYGDVSQFVARGRRRWMPAIPAGKVAPQHNQAAMARAKVVGPLLESRGSEAMAELVRLALEAWRASGGYEISGRTMRRWIERAIERDRGYGEWTRWDIYLDDDLSPAQPRRFAPEEVETHRLREVLNGISHPLTPSAQDRDQVWAAAMNDTAVLLDAGHEAVLVQKAILAALLQSGIAIAKNESALRKAYRRKWDAWTTGGEVSTAIQDRRVAANGARVFELPAVDRLQLISLARTRGNQLAPAYREAHQRRLLTAETLARFPTLPRDKSFVPHSIRRAVSPFLEIIATNGRGPRARQLNGAHIVPDWSEVRAGDVFEFDDLTLPLYWWIEDPSKPQGYYFGAGQVLMSVDSKTGYILSWLLIARPGYNARDIMQLVREVHDSYGLPRQYLLFERGIWQRSRLISGEPGERDSDDMCGGLQSLWPVKHAHSPTGKAIVERTFGLIQARMEHLPGYTGRDMRKDCPEVTKRAIGLVKGGHDHPSKYFLHGSQVMELLETIATAHNGEPLGTRTRRIPGQTPREVFEARDSAGMGYFGPESSHLFRTHRIERRVTSEGIRLPDSLGGAVYRSEATGPLIGQRVLCWVDPVDLDTIFITDLLRHNPRLIQRTEEPAARGASPDSIGQAREQAAAHMGFVDVLTRSSKPKLEPADFRPVLADGPTQRLAVEMQQQRQTHEESVRAEAKMRREIETAAANKGIAIAAPSDSARMQEITEILRSDDDQHWSEVNRRASEKVDL